jgi:quinol monooxygenase YgiN
MIVVLVQVESSAEDIDALRETLCEMETTTRAEAGCHDYAFSQEISDPSRLRIVELWESMDALRLHFATPHMAAFNAALASRPPKSMTLKVHELGAELELPS